MLLRPYLSTYYSGTSSPAPSIDTTNLLRWLAQMQGTHVELGGFRGRTNKLVDGCYSWWVGGCFALVEELLEHRKATPVNAVSEESEEEGESESAWGDVDGLSIRTLDLY